MSSEESPPAKRQRTENASITRSEIWHGDGSVILQADGVQFRGLPQPPGQPSVDGCPVVELQDSVEDVGHLLKVLYSPYNALPFSVVAALIGLGRKYDFRELLDSAVARLMFDNPSTLKELDGLNSKLDLQGSLSHTTRIIDYPGILFDMLTLARENDILVALPCAYFRAASYHTQAQILDANAFLGTSALAEQRRCILGRQKILTAQSRPGYTLGWVRSWAPAEGCTQPEECNGVRTELLHKCLDALSTWALQFYDELGLTFCTACQAPTEAVRAGREKIWEDMPGFFDLPPWSELRNNV
ncbi:hypothetical protein B0H17DRAFT_1204182 [Mycena rosella]|uniref:BTB domain-containing protein n=1 Tax=Mycena rosella TaxID=1033263 RepID=A0AAD7GG53_MYCRO|nr:hypothetical protein B0H17DRAFT_1204182 [Mycena rosella]